MTYTMATELLRLSFIAIALPALGANASDVSPGQSAGQPATRPASEPRLVTTTQHIDFASGGTIHIEGSYGILRVEGSDRPEVTVTVTRALPYGYEPKHPGKAKRRLDALRVVAERQSATELTISTSQSSLGIEYEIQVPRNSSLAIHHRVGYVSVSGVTGDIDATCRRGDLVLWLPEKASYSIDARSKVGTVASDFPGNFAIRYLVGQRYTHEDASPSRRVHARVGFGGVTIQPILPESEAPIASGR